MKVTISFLHMAHTESLDQKIKEKSKKLAKYFKKDPHVKWTCSVKNGVHTADVSVQGPKGFYQASSKTSCLYKTLDQVIHKLEKQIMKEKDQVKLRLHKKVETPDMHDLDSPWEDLKKAA